jgi:hypothetical protein
VPAAIVSIDAVDLLCQKEYPTTNGVMKRISYNKWCYEKNILQQMVL